MGLVGADEEQGGLLAWWVAGVVGEEVSVVAAGSTAELSLEGFGLLGGRELSGAAYLCGEGVMVLESGLELAQGGGVFEGSHGAVPGGSWS